MNVEAGTSVPFYDGGHGGNAQAQRSNGGTVCEPAWSVAATERVAGMAPPTVAATPCASRY